MINDLLKLAHDESPDLISKVASYLQMIEKLDVDYAKETVAELEAIANFAQEKTAGAKNVLLVLGGALGAGLGNALATDLYDAAKRGLTKSTNFKRIMAANPHLKAEVDDPKKIKPAYDALHRYAPEFTADPMLGGALLRSIANSPPGAEAQLIEKLIGSRKDLSDSKKTFKLEANIGKYMIEDPRTKKDHDRGGSED